MSPTTSERTREDCRAIMTTPFGEGESATPRLFGLPQTMMFSTLLPLSGNFYYATPVNGFQTATTTDHPGAARPPHGEGRPLPVDHTGQMARSPVVRASAT